MSFCPPFFSFVAHPNGVHPPFLPCDCDFSPLSCPSFSYLFFFSAVHPTVTTGRTTEKEMAGKWMGGIVEWRVMSGGQLSSIQLKRQTIFYWTIRHDTVFNMSNIRKNSHSKIYRNQFHSLLFHTKTANWSRDRWLSSRPHPPHLATHFVLCNQNSDHAPSSSLSPDTELVRKIKTPKQQQK